MGNVNMAAWLSQKKWNPPNDQSFPLNDHSSGASTNTVVGS
ncbi:MAG: hypothetical protein AAGH79_07230 [Bacteroidota bacterium]